MDTIFHLQPWTPEVSEVAAETMSGIQEIVPELEVLFMGAAALQLPGKNDIDLDILCAAENIDHYTRLLIPLLGIPKARTETSTAWECIRKGYEIDCILSDPAVSHVPKQRNVFEALKNTPRLLKEYEQLKRECNGLPYEIYEARKQKFFAKVLEIR